MLKYTVPTFTAALLLGVPICFLATAQAVACGDESGLSCGNEEDDARYLLTQAVAAMRKDETSALTWFTEQSHGFRTEDLYAFCIGPDHIMSAQPDPKINYTNSLRA